jgi:hypothetical protein
MPKFIQQGCIIINIENVTTVIFRESKQCIDFYHQNDHPVSFFFDNATSYQKAAKHINKMLAPAVF